MEKAEATRRILCAARGVKPQRGEILTFETDADGKPVCTNAAKADGVQGSILVCVARTKEDVQTFDALTETELMETARAAGRRA